ncbi:MAG: hypothetical protein M3P08_04200 [Thermoproteota archaeon]|nr:hypothetical protein [Thermoproteota archaeon]
MALTQSKRKTRGTFVEGAKQKIAVVLQLVRLEALLELINTKKNIKWKKIGRYRLFWKVKRLRELLPIGKVGCNKISFLLTKYFPC